MTPAGGGALVARRRYVLREKIRGPMRVTGYVRVSTAEQVEGYSLEVQEEAIRRFCAGRGWPAPIIYREEGFSAWTDEVAKRPAFARLLADVEAGAAQCVVVHQIDRWARSVLVSLRELQTLERAGATFASVQEQLDFTTPFGRAMLGMFAIFAQLYSDQLSVRVKGAIAAKKAAGGHHGQIPFGAVRVAGRLAVDPARAGELRLLLELIARESSGRTAAELNRRGIRARRGGPWSEASVLKAVFHGAWLAAQPAPWPALWAAALNRPRLPPVPGPRAPRLLSGKLRCGCGGVITYARRGPGSNMICRNFAARPNGYGCPHQRTHAGYYEAVVQERFLAWRVRPEADEPPARDVAAERAALAERRRLLGVALATQTMAEAEFHRRLADLAREEAALAATPRRAAAGVWLPEVQGAWWTRPEGERAALLREVLDVVIITGRAVEVVPRDWLAPLLLPTPRAE